ncbi:2-amino-4-hydroxy-6-hydroxymethyldihydropteridine diphosphokinase [Eubacteriaceae bacterium ES2]|nr:2-amino-4-hydroxy-6-hydroxymethyldihydropteridine diphosphokinase [Eubacteriaceae bacterium ES2]
MDYLTIKDLEVFAFHGVFPEEKKLGQKFLISIVLSLDMRPAAISNDLTKSVHYGQLSHELEEEFKKESYDLIETAGEKLAIYVLEHYDMVKSVSITIKKPWAPILRSMDTVSIELNRTCHQVYIGLGSNLGDRLGNIENAIAAIESLPGVRLLKTSSIIETPPWGYEDQEPFLNNVIQIKTYLPPYELMDYLLAIELDLGRQRQIHWGPRTIDLDILFYDDLISDDPHIILPHPRIWQREFVLKSLAEIAPYFVHPVKKANMLELLEAVSQS